MLFQSLKVLAMEAEFSEEPMSSIHLSDLNLMRDPSNSERTSPSDLTHIGRQVPEGKLSYEDALHLCDKKILE